MSRDFTMCPREESNLCDNPTDQHKQCYLVEFHDISTTAVNWSSNR